VVKDCWRTDIATQIEFNVSLRIRIGLARCCLTTRFKACVCKVVGFWLGFANLKFWLRKILFLFFFRFGRFSHAESSAPYASAASFVT